MFVTALETFVGVAPESFEWITYLVGIMIFLLVFQWLLDIIIIVFRLGDRRFRK